MKRNTARCLTKVGIRSEHWSVNPLDDRHVSASAGAFGRRGSPATGRPGPLSRSFVLNTQLRQKRILSDKFEEALQSGILRPLLSLVQRDRDLIAEIRVDLLDVYCKGQRLVGVEPVTENGPYRFTSHAAFWATKTKVYADIESVAAFCLDDVPRIKQRIAEHHATGKEIEFEQMLIRSNNLEALNTDYIAVDRQGVAEDGKGRTDVVGVFWPGERRVSNDPLRPALIEVKYGLHGGIEDVAGQVKRYYDDISRNPAEFAEALQCQLRQKARLELLSGLSKRAQTKIRKLPVSSKIEDMRVVIALVDYNPRARRLDEEQLKKLPFADQIDLFHLGFGMWERNSASKN